ncbi:MAG: hypothetical protein ACRD1W_05720 [Vicinamibacterales bacterium]
MRVSQSSPLDSDLGVKLMNFSQRSLGPFCAALALAFAITGGASQAFAGTITFPSIEISIEGNSEKFTYSPSASDYRRATNADGGYELTEQKHFDILGNWAHLMIEQLQWDPDPFVLDNILVTNTTDSTLTFSAFVGLPTTFPAPNFISGNVSTSVIDGGRAGATVAAIAGDSLYAAQIDGATVATLQDFPFSLIAPGGGSNTASASFGPLASAVPVTSFIGIQLRFSLTPGDTASILSRFDVVESVPDAGSSAALVAIALPFVVAMTTRSRRRKAKPSA